jgi:hypothetical protein
MMNASNECLIRCYFSPAFSRLLVLSRYKHLLYTGTKLLLNTLLKGYVIARKQGDRMFSITCVSTVEENSDVLGGLQTFMLKTKMPEVQNTTLQSSTDLNTQPPLSLFLAFSTFPLIRSFILSVHVYRRPIDCLKPSVTLLRRTARGPLSERASFDDLTVISEQCCTHYPLLH